MKIISCAVLVYLCTHCSGITKWIHKWKRNGWKLANGGDVINREDFESLDQAMKGMNIQWVSCVCVCVFVMCSCMYFIIHDCSSMFSQNMCFFFQFSFLNVHAVNSHLNQSLKRLEN